MVLSETLISIFVSIVGFANYYLAYKRKAIMWSVIGTTLFAANVAMSGSIPFSTDASGYIIGTGFNYGLMGFNLLFAFFGLIYSIHLAFDFLKKA